MAMSDNIFEFRGTKNVVIAKVLTDTEEGITFGEVKKLSPNAQIGVTTESSSEAHYYDDNPLIVIRSEGADTVTLTQMPPELSVLAEVTGQRFDSSRGMMITGDAQPDYYALGYIAEGTDGRERYVWRYKGQFSIPEEAYQTKDNSTTANNTTLTYTGIATVYKFSHDGKAAKSIVVDTAYGSADVTNFFAQVTTPDNLPAVSGLTTPAPEIVPTASTFTNSIDITIACAYPDAFIYYTTDGSTPTTEDAYTGPFPITATTTVKAFANRTGGTQSAVVAKTFYKI